MKIAVFCASAERIDRIFFEDARKLGKETGRMGWQLVYGGTNIGLMREVALATMNAHGKVTGIIPECIRSRGVAAGDIDQLIVVPDMKERKQMLRDQADAFIALPGGWGTLEEITEVITLKQLGQHNKPIVFLNSGGYYDGFFDFIRKSREQGFIAGTYDRLYYVADSVEEVLEYLLNYREEKIKEKY